jgi:predicted RNA-binding Zn ribbon-like protein
VGFVGFFGTLGVMDAADSGFGPTSGRDQGGSPSGHQKSGAAPAPGDLEAVRSFLSLHEHAPGDPTSLPPSTRSLERWLRERREIGRDETAEEVDLGWGLEVRDALRTKVAENHGRPRDPDAIDLLNRAATDTGLSPCFGCHDRGLHVEATGVRGAVGRLLGTAFLTDLDGTFHRLRHCQGPTCTSVFYDRSKNHSAKWCSMASCGNRNKVRRFRERERAAARAGLAPASGTGPTRDDEPA